MPAKIETYIQSGNVVFEPSVTDEETIRTDISDAIDQEFECDISVMVRSLAELEDIVDGQPFDEPDDDSIKRYVTFLHEVPTEQQHEALLAA